ncbi:MAG: hypothetical protein ACOC38_11090 [Promethearchaeia archaeon]
MTEITIEDTTNMLDASYDLFSEEKTLVTMQSGCIWARLFNDTKPVGIVFAGPANFAVDAIVETERGAVGQSTSGSLQGVQVYFGTADLEEVSRTAKDSDCNPLGYEGAHGFHEDAKATLKNLGASKGGMKSSMDGKNVLIGKDEGRKKIILIAKENETVFIRGESVFVVGDELVTVDENRVTVTESSGKTITVGKNGLEGSSLFGINGLGQTISTLVGKSMMGLKGLKGLKSLKKLKFREVDDLDWDDEE